MAIARDPTSFEILRTDGIQRAVAKPERSFDPDDFDHHIETYKGFLRGVMLFVAHLALILAVLAFFLLRT